MTHHFRRVHFIDVPVDIKGHLHHALVELAVDDAWIVAQLGPKAARSAQIYGAEAQHRKASLFGTAVLVAAVKRGCQ